VALGAAGLAGDYDVRVLRHDVQDYNAVTRFVHFQLASSARSPLGPAAAEGNRLWKTTLVITPSTSATGVLAHVFSCFSDRRINVLSVSSRPLAAPPGAYAFVVTVAAAGDSAPLGHAALNLIETGNQLKHLGSYPADPIPQAHAHGARFDAPSGS